MEFDENIRKLCREMAGFSSATPVNEKCTRLDLHFKKASETDRAKMLFFLILNTDLNLGDELRDSYEVGFLIGMCPTLGPGELCDIIVSLELVGALSDIVSSCPADMSSVILRRLREKIVKTENKFDYCRKLALSLHDKYNKKFGDANEELKNDLFDVFLMFLPSSWKESEGRALEDSLQEINCQLQIWQNCLRCRILGDDPLFFIPVRGEVFIPILEVNRPVGRTGKSFSDFLSDFKIFAESVVLDGEDDSHLKRSARENAYFLYETIKGNQILKFEEEKWLRSVMKEPSAENTTDFDIDTVIEKIVNREAGRQWVKALINFPDWLETEGAISCVAGQVDAMDVEDLKKVVECLQAVSCGLVGRELCTLYLDCFEKLPANEQVSYLNRHFEGSRNFSWEIKEEELTEKFNKVSESDGSDEKMKSWLMTMCIKSPWMIIRKLCKWGLYNAGALKHSVEYLKAMRGACLSQASEEAGIDTITSVLKSVIDEEDLTPCEKRSLVALVDKLQGEKLLDFAYVNACILNVIEKELVAGDFEKVAFAVELLKSSLKWKNVVGSREVVLAAFTVRVLSHASWDYSSFSMQLAHAREALTSVADSLMKSVVGGLSETEGEWLRREILKSSLVNQLCFTDFLFPDGLPSKELYVHLLALLHTKTGAHSIIDSVVSEFQSKKFLELRALFTCALIKVLPVLTTKEWETLFVHLRSIVEGWSDTQFHDPEISADLVVVDMLTLSMYCLAQDVNRYGDASACFEFCIRNYGNVIQRNFPSETIARAASYDLAKKIMFLLSGIRDSSFRKSNSTILSCILVDLIGGRAAEDDEGLRELEEWFKKDFIQE